MNHPSENLVFGKENTFDILELENQFGVDGIEQVFPFSDSKRETVKRFELINKNKNRINIHY